jgi:hypothetical protein
VSAPSTWFCVANVLVDHDGSAWAVYLTDSVSYPLLPQARKLALLERVAAFAAGARGDLVLWRTHHHGRVVVLVAVRLDVQRPRSALAVLCARALRTRHAVPARLVLGRAELVRIADAERGVRAHAVETLGARPATGRDVARLLIASLPEREGVDPNAPAAAIALADHTLHVEPMTTARARCSAVVVDHPRAIEIVGAGERAFQCVMVLGVLPDGLEFPGRAELLSGPLERCGVVVDAAVHCEWVANARALRLAGRTVLDAEHAASEQLATGRVPDTRLATQLDTAVGYRRYLEAAAAPPILRASVALRVAAPTVAALDDAVARLAAALAPVHASVPAYVQRRLWERFDLPGPPLPGATVQPLTVEQLGAMVPAASEHAGTRSGPVIGRVGATGAPVRLDLRAASASARPPSVLCVGTLGSGKTVTSQLLAIQALESGSLVVDVDPKPDHRLDQLPQLAGRTRIVDLSDVERHAGLLDPLRIPDDALRDEVAASYYADLVGADARTRAVLRATLAALDPTARSSTAFASALAGRAEPEARAAAEQLAAWSRSGLARLALAPPAAPCAEDGGVADLTSIRCRTLVLPSGATPRGEYTDSERVGAATMRLIAAYALGLMRTGGPQRHKLLMVDEAWLLLASSDGRSLIDRINRTGRSENATLLLATQQLADVAHVAPLIGTHLVFGVETTGEARLAAELLGIDDSPSTVQLLTGQRAGRALMRDVRGRVARIQIDPGTDLLAALSTTPGDAR